LKKHLPVINEKLRFFPQLIIAGTLIILKIISEGSVMKKNMAMVLCGLLVGCGPYVTVSNQGEKVRLLDKSEVSSCQHLGGTTVSVLDKVAFIERGKTSVEDNLQALARNSAAEMSGDTIVATSAITDGKQNYDVYRCVNPQGR